MEFFVVVAIYGLIIMIPYIIAFCLDKRGKSKAMSGLFVGIVFSFGAAFIAGASSGGSGNYFFGGELVVMFVTFSMSFLLCGFTTSYLCYKKTPTQQANLEKTKVDLDETGESVSTDQTP